MNIPPKIGSRVTVTITGKVRNVYAEYSDYPNITIETVEGEYVEDIIVGAKDIVITRSHSSLYDQFVALPKGTAFVVSRETGFNDLIYVKLNDTQYTFLSPDDAFVSASILSALGWNDQLLEPNPDYYLEVWGE